MYDVIIIFVISLIAGVLAAKKISAKSRIGTQNTEAARITQNAVREMLSRKYGASEHGSEMPDFDLMDVVASPIFAIACLAIGGMFMAHPDSTPLAMLLVDPSPKPFFLLIGQVWLFSMTVCSIVLIFKKRGKK